MKLINIKSVLLFLFAIFSMSAQQKLDKVSQSIKANKDVTIDLNTSHTTIELETWNKDYIEVEAYIESDKLSKEELQKTLDAWQVIVEGSSDLVTITSDAKTVQWNNLALFDDENFSALRNLELSMANFPEMPELPEMPEMLMNINMPEMPEMPELPELPEGMADVNFSYELYKKDGEKYLEKWSKDYDAKYGKDYKEKMRVWAKKLEEIDFEAYEKKMEVWGEKFSKEWEGKFGKDFEQKMEAWGKEFEEKFGKDFEQKMEAWGKQFEENFGEDFEKQMDLLSDQAKKAERQLKNDERQYAKDKRQARLNDREKILNERLFDSKLDLKTKKTIKIKMPKKAKLKLNVRHGELKMASVLTNSKGKISHSSIILNNIDGEETSINVSYSNVNVNQWNAGELKLNYIENATIKNANNLVLSAVSSNIKIDNLSGNTLIDGSFGDLSIKNISDNFNNLNIVLENSEAMLSLPKTDFNLFFKGNRSKFNDEIISNKTIKNYPNNNSNTNKTIVINAKFSNVITQ